MHANGRWLTFVLFVCLLSASVSNKKVTFKPTPSIKTMKKMLKIGVDTTLEEFCLAIKMANCTCEHLPPSFPFCRDDKNASKLEIHDNLIIQTEHAYDKVSERIRATITTIASILGIIGNSLIIAVSGKRGYSIGRCKLLIVVLALCDLIFAIFQLMIIIPLFWTLEWLYGVAMCKILISGNTLGSLLAIGIILIIAIERYVGITLPFSYGLSRRVRYLLIIINCILGIAVITPYALVLTVTQDGICQEQWSSKPSLFYKWLLLILYFVCPATVISILYFRIIRTLYIHVQDNADLNANDYQNQVKRLKDNKRVMIIFICVLLAFLLLVLPNQLVWVIFEHLRHEYGNLSRLSIAAYKILKYVALIPYPFHVCCNPLIYALIDGNLRKELISMCRHCLKIPPEKPSSPLGSRKRRRSTLAMFLRFNKPNIAGNELDDEFVEIVVPATDS